MNFGASELRAFFEPGGVLERTLPGYERRDEQLEMALAVADSLRTRQDLLAEAGTGIGKSLAYLVPIVANAERAVVSTATRNLQDQLYEKDIPDVIRSANIEIPVVVMKGRRNYVCLVRAESHAAQGQLWDTAGQGDSFDAWLANTNTGDLSELSSVPESKSFYRKVTATAEQCDGHRCQAYDRCFITRMRRRAEEAQLVLVNHHLYLADVALRRSHSAALVPSHDVVVFDEAHGLDTIAARQLGYQIAEGRVTELLDDLESIDDEKIHRDQHARIAKDARSLFVSLPFAATPSRLGQDLLRGAPAEAYRRLRVCLVALIELLDGSDQRRQRLVERFQSLCDDFDRVFDVPSEMIRFTEQSGGEKRIVASPNDIASTLQSHLEPNVRIYVSATLSVDRDFSYIRRRLGISSATEISLGSPFDYARQVRLYLPDDLPPIDDSRFARLAIERTRELVQATRGGAFVLCTSRRMVEEMRRGLAGGAGLLLVQGDAPRNRLVDAFRDHGSAVLVGTNSLWHGVDVAGSALRLVIIDRLPFGNPKDPLNQGQLEFARSQGQDPFSSVQLPKATLALKQGFGRLIRRQGDHGVVAILDPRLTRRGYGKVFLRSLPAAPQIRSLEEVRAFFSAR